MNANYSDITEELGDPGWWDENAVPRYCKFHPSKLADIYARECALLLIVCQNCKYEFKVAVSYDFINELRKQPTLEERINGDPMYIEYGDPPNNGCCPSGATMNSDTIGVLEYWKQNKNNEWEKLC